MRLTLLRHATLGVEHAGLRLLVDPMLDPKGARPPVASTPSEAANPLVDLPAGWEAWLEDLDAVLVTHTHEDHLDEAAVAALRERPQVPVLCQPEDAEALRGRGLADVRPVEHATELQGVPIHRTGGRHGFDPGIEDLLGPVSGFVVGGDPSLYVVGDSVWHEDVRHALDEHAPDVVVLNTGSARFLEGDRITMDAWDVGVVAHHAPPAALVCVHLEAINHCLLPRERLRAQLAAAGVDAVVPADGDVLELGG